MESGSFNWDDNESEFNVAPHAKKFSKSSNRRWIFSIYISIFSVILFIIFDPIPPFLFSFISFPFFFNCFNLSFSYFANFFCFCFCSRSSKYSLEKY